MSKRKLVKDTFNGEVAEAYSYPLPQQPAYYPAPAPPDVHSVSISVLSSHGATVAKAVYASVYSTGIPVSASGAAKREPGDDYDRETGKLLATSRALEILAGKLRRKANSRIRNAEAIRRHRAEVKKRDKLRELAGSGPARDSYSSKAEKKGKKGKKLERIFKMPFPEVGKGGRRY